MTHEAKVTQWIGAGKIGVEIGPGHSPIPGFSPRPIYIDCFKEFAAEKCQADFYGHASALPFHDNSLDYVASSHVLEHSANPVAALGEWYRVLRPEGLIYLVVPDRRKTWDHTRQLTPVAHLLEDYALGTTACDPTHIDEFLNDADWSKWDPTLPADAVPAKRAELSRAFHGAVAAGLDINIHFHTFERESLVELFETLQTWPTRRFNWEVVDTQEHFPAHCPNGVFVAVRVHKGWYDRARAEAFDVTAGPDRRAAVMRPEAQPFAEFVKTCSGLGGVR